MLKFKNHIILDQKETWPVEILDLIIKSEESLKNFLNEEKKIDLLEQTNIQLRYIRTANNYSEIWNKVISQIEIILKEYMIIGFHCTKLIDYEINDILANGLMPLNKDFAIKRITRLCEEDLISKELKQHLIKKEELNADNRVDLVCLFHCLSTLKDENGLNKLLGLWGGEAIYSEIGETVELKNIGISCIVITSIKQSELPSYFGLSKRLLAIYFNDDFFSHDTDSFIKNKVKVLKVIRRNDKLFNKLTNIDNWKEFNI